MLIFHSNKHKIFPHLTHTGFYLQYHTMNHIPRYICIDHHLGHVYKVFYVPEKLDIPQYIGRSIRACKKLIYDILHVQIIIKYMKNTIDQVFKYKLKNVSKCMFSICCLFFMFNMFETC